MKSEILIFMIALTGCLCACQQEDELEPLDVTNSFATSPGATDEETKLKENFYNTTGCHLLFNDTLRHEYKGTDENGKPYYETELLGLEYQLTSTSNFRFKFDYLQTLEQKRQVTAFLQNDLLPYIKNVMPYSLLVANGIDEYQRNTMDVSYDYVGSPLTYNNLRCLALNVSRLWGLTQEERTAYAQDICCEIIFASFGGTAGNKYTDGKAGQFFSINYNNYSTPKSYWWDPTNILNPLELGFLEDPYENNFSSPKEDAVAYIKACLSMTEEEFFEKYGENDINGYTRQKYDIIKPLLEATGIKFN